MAWTYILRCADDSLYVGSTRNLDSRMVQHASGRGSRYTSRRLPVELVWAREAEHIGAAWEFERTVHGWGRRKREALIRGDLDALPALSKRGVRNPPRPPTPERRATTPTLLDERPTTHTAR